MKKISLTSLLVFLVVAVFGQNTLVWKVSGKGAGQPSYLFGTIHAICPDDFFIPEKLKEIVPGVDNLFLEIDMTDPAFMQKMTQGSMNPQMKNIKADLSEENQRLVDSALLKVMGFGLDQIGIMKPWALAAAISVRSGVECDEFKTYEMELVKLVSADSIPVKGLETVEDQLALFDGMPYDQQLEWLVEAVTDMGKNKVMLNQLIGAYKDQDVHKLYELMLDQDEMEEFSEVLLDKRNESWIPVIEKAMLEGSNLFAFGAGHLGGDKGVINLLRKAGYTVEPVQ